MSARRFLFLLGSVFGLIGLGVLAGGFYAQRSAAAFDAAAVRTTGVVVDFETRRSSGSKSTSTTYAPFEGVQLRRTVVAPRHPESLGLHLVGAEL